MAAVLHMGPRKILIAGIPPFTVTYAAASWYFNHLKRQQTVDFGINRSHQQRRHSPPVPDHPPAPAPVRASPRRVYIGGVVSVMAQMIRMPETE